MLRLIIMCEAGNNQWWAGDIDVDDNIADDESDVDVVPVVIDVDLHLALPLHDCDDDDDGDLYIIGAVCLSQKWLFCPTEPSRTFRNLLEPSGTF